MGGSGRGWVFPLRVIFGFRILELGSGEEGLVPVFPDGIQIFVAEGAGYFFDGAGIVDAKLAGGAAFGGFGFEFDAAAFEG